VVPKTATTPIWKALVKNQFLVLVTQYFYCWLVLILFIGLISGVDQNYEPIQPIHYSHKIHAGDNDQL
jgi:hypothetical protein